MVSIKDILTIVLLFIISIIAAFIFAVAGYFYISIIVLLLFLGIKYYLKRSKKILPFVQEDFNELGYELLSERTVKLSDLEVKSEVKIPYVSVDGLSINRYGYVRKFTRTFMAISLKNELLYEITANVTKLWNGKNVIVILSEKQVDI